jgi:hypothetical protein
MSIYQDICEGFADVLRGIDSPIDFSQSVYINKADLNDFAESELPAMSVFLLGGAAEESANNLLAGCIEKSEIYIEGHIPIGLDQLSVGVGISMVDTVLFALKAAHAHDRTLGGVLSDFSYKNGGRWSVAESEFNDVDMLASFQIALTVFFISPNASF